MTTRYTLFFSFIFITLFASCVAHKELVNFRSGKEKEPYLGNTPKQEIVNQADMKLQFNDVLGIIIMSPDGVLATPYNLIPPQLSIQTLTATSPSTYLIGEDGMIHLPSLGSFKAAGLTVKELREEVLKKLNEFLENPSVNIRLINFKVAVFGEVEHPGSFQIENERITVLEALSRAGDLTAFSNRSHIMVIRERNGVREYGDMNLKDTKFFTSPYYYLQQNDVVYVEPSKGKIAQVQQPINTYLQPIQAVISILALILALRK